MTTKKKSSPKTQEEINERCDQCIDHIESAREKFLQMDGVLGVGYGPKEKRGKILEEEPSIIVYVEEKKDKKHLSPDEIIPTVFHDLPTDVVVPGERNVPFHNDYDSMWLDRSKIHEQNPDADVNLEPMVDYDIEDVAVLEIDNTFVTGNTIDFAKATKRFLNSHPDVFDFITFYVDTSTGLPSQGSYHSGIYNKTTGINYYAGSNLDKRSTFGTTKLQAYLSLGWFGNGVLLQEFGHMWGAYVRNRDTQAGSNRYDLLIGPTGQGKFHWGRFFDNDHSPMDYDGIDWQALGGNQFKSHGIGNDYYHFCPLDLYLMGLISKTAVGTFYVIQSPSGNSGTITGTKKNISVQNVIWAEGDRNPAYPNTQKVWKQAFVVLTKNAQASKTFAEQVADQRRDFTWQFYKATRYLGKADTTLRSNILFPVIRDISVAVDNDRAIIGWKTNVRTKGQVNYATSPSAFRRDQAHTEPFSTVNDNVYGTSHGVQLTGLASNAMYYFEIIAETERGLFDRKGLERLYTRKTNDTCPPDINNVSVRKGKRNSVKANWRTDEPATSLLYFGTSTPPTKLLNDRYPTTNHAMQLRGLKAGVYYIRVASRDAAGNMTSDDNNGNYYQVTIPSSAAPSAMPLAAGLEEPASQSDAINVAIDEGNMAMAIEQTSNLLLSEATRELANIYETTPLPDDDLEAAYMALEILASRMESEVEVVERGDEFIDFAFNPDPLRAVVWINLPGDLVAEEAGYPVLSEIISSVRQELTLEPHPTRGLGHYRLSRAYKT